MFWVWFFLWVAIIVAVLLTLLGVFWSFVQKAQERLWIELQSVCRENQVLLESFQNTPSGVIALKGDLPELPADLNRWIQIDNVRMECMADRRSGTFPFSPIAAAAALPYLQSLFLVGNHSGDFSKFPTRLELRRMQKELILACMDFSNVEKGGIVNRVESLTIQDCSHLEQLLGSFVHLKKLSVWESPITKEVMQEIFALPNLEELSLRSNFDVEISAEDMQRISSLAHIRSLKLAIDFNDSLLAICAQRPNLREITFYNTEQVSHSGWESLKSSASLDAIEFAIQLPAAEEFAGIRGQPSISSVSLSSRCGPAPYSFFETLSELPNLRRVFIDVDRDRNFGEYSTPTFSLRGAMRFANHSKWQELVTWRFPMEPQQPHTPYLTRSELRLLAGEADGEFRKEFWIASGMLDVAGQLKHLHRADQLQFLKLDETDICDEDMEDISNVSGLTAIDLSKTLVSDSGIAKLSGLRNLRELRAAGMTISFESLRCTAMSRLAISSEAITPAGWNALCRLSSLEFLQIENSTLGQLQCDQIASMESLVELDLLDCEIDGKVLARLVAALDRNEVNLRVRTRSKKFKEWDPVFLRG